MVKKYNIAVIPGDGTGPEVVEEGIKVLDAVAEKSDFGLNFTHCNIYRCHRPPRRKTGYSRKGPPFRSQGST
jgi:isocitrate/isopropylmalate dehydrogenase